jgi:cyclic pyranopterin phosphate synthase
VTLLIDRYGRVARDLRISVTDRCDLRCTYCMPEDGLDWIAPDQQLSFEEILKLSQVLVDLGIRSVRLTGG